jgi:hypothetical protein
MSELYVKIPGLVYERDLLSNNNCLSDLRKFPGVLWFSQRPSAHALLRPDWPTGTIH